MKLETNAIFGIQIAPPQTIVRLETTFPDNDVVIFPDRHLFVNQEAAYTLACEALMVPAVSKLTKAILRIRDFGVMG